MTIKLELAHTELESEPAESNQLVAGPGKPSAYGRHEDDPFVFLATAVIDACRLVRSGGGAREVEEWGRRRSRGHRGAGEARLLLLL